MGQSPLKRLRWVLARPLQTRLVPNWVPVVHLPILRHAPFLTVGQVLLLMQSILLLIAGWTNAFINPSTKGSGQIALFSLILTFLLASKSSSIFWWLFGLSHERIVPFHNLSACLTLVLACFHASVIFRYGASKNESQYGLNGPSTNLWRFLWDGDTNMAGALMVSCMLVLIIMSFFRYCRKQNFEVWLIVHITVCLLIIFLGVLHGAGLIVLAVVAWALDLVFRYLVQAAVRYPKKAIVTKVSKDVVEVRMKTQPGQFEFDAGQFVRIAFPALNRASFHPITISSSPYQQHKYITAHIKNSGDWTQRVHDFVEQNEDQEVDVLLEGPYGKSSMDLQNDGRYPIVLCVSGGIGITPNRSIACQLVHEHVHDQRRLERLHIIWTNRDLHLVRAFPLFEFSAWTEAYSQSPDQNGNETHDESGIPAERRRRVESLFNTVQCDIHVTGPMDDPESIGAISSPKAGGHIGPTIGVSHGRPKFEEILQNLKSLAKERGLHNVAVIGCGPRPMVDQLKLLCRCLSDSALAKDRVVFDFHEEIFEY